MLPVIFVLTVLTCFQFFGCWQEKQCEMVEDFPLFYKAARDATSNDTSAIYDVAAARSVLQAMTDGSNPSFHPFLYPPQGLLLIAPLGFLEYKTALCLWFALPFLLLLPGLHSSYVQKMKVPFRTLLVLFSPFIMVNVVAGQNGMFWAALFIITLACRRAMPWIAGITLALFSIKPQLGLFLPVLLLYEKNWRVLMVAAATVLLMMIATTCLFGSNIWQDYAHTTQVFSAIQRLAPAKYVMVAASPYMALRMLHLTADMAYGLQIVVSLATLAAVWTSLKYCKCENDILLMLAFATFLFSPYSYIYDTILLALPCAVLFSRIHHDAAGRIGFILLAFIPIIAVRIQYYALPYCFAVIAFAFIYTITSLRQSNHG